MAMFVAMFFGLGGRVSIPGKGKRIFSAPQNPDLLWDPASLLAKGYR
jgi:hypothetical protein